MDDWRQVSLDTELQHVAAEARTLVHSAREPDYVEVLLRAARLQRETDAALVDFEVGRPPRNVPSKRRPPIVPAMAPDPRYETRWHDPPVPPAVEDQKDTQPEPLATEFSCEAWWHGDPAKYQKEAAMAAVAGGITVSPWNWIESTCGNAMCLEPKHMILRKPQRLLYPSGVCVYCGEYADTRDHLLPVTYTGAAVRRHVLTVPACRQCNSLIGDAYAPSITERRAIAHNGLRRKYFKLLQSYDFTDEELEDFGHAMKSSVIRAGQEKQTLLRRLEFPGGIDYDIHYLSSSGIEDPYAFGLIKADEKASNRRRR
ncbi:MAG TPA: hypothetical protein VJQ60_11915 [Arthrobacter sp.]|nr:hypothetical protein [Arthrobacter sp.]